MSEEQFSEFSVWGNHCEINTENRYFLTSDSGKGKSTFSSYIIGLRFDYAGSISINGQEQTKISLEEWSTLRKEKIGFLAQDMRLFPNMTVMENLLIKNKLTDYKTELEIIKLLDILQISHKQQQMAGTLSLGQQQRVAIVRSLLQPYELLLMDEPFSHIDNSNTDLALKMIQDECTIQNAGYVMTSLGSLHGIEDNLIIRL